MKVNNNWAYKQNENELHRQNVAVYKDLIEEGYYVANDDTDDPKAIVRRFTFHGYGGNVHELTRVPEELSTDEVALLLDGPDGLPFGYEANKNQIKIYTN